MMNLRSANSRYVCLILAVAAMAIEVESAKTEAAEPEPSRPLDLTDIIAVRKMRPILIAHRGGVVTPQSPECSLAAVRKAAAAGYHLVELDVRRSRDHVSVVFHDPHLERATGLKGRVDELELKDLIQVRYRQTDETISTLDTALATCKKLGLGVMLDIKVADSPRMLEQVVDLVRKHGLEKSTVTLNGDPKIATPLAAVSFVQLKVKPQAPRPLKPGQPLAGYFWFGLPADLPRDEFAAWQQDGALVVPAINTFRYPTERHCELAAQDIRQLRELGVDGFQIDSVYQTEFGLPE